MAVTWKTHFAKVGANRWVNSFYEDPATGATVGDVFYVHSSGSSTATGLSPEDPVSTIDGGINLCTANKMNRIVVLPGHAENVTTATGINADVAGIEIIGLGNGPMMPTVSYTAAAGSLTVGAANVTIKNIKFSAAFATGVTSGITIAAGGDGCVLDGLVFRDSAANNEFLIHVSVATTVDDLNIRNCSFVGLAGESMTNSILFAGTSTNCVIENCYFFVDSSDDVIDHLAGASVNFVVRNCVVVNADTDAAGYCLRYKSDGTGIAYNNYFAYNKVDAEISVGAAAWWIQNFATNTIAESARLDPTTAHAIP